MLWALNYIRPDQSSLSAWYSEENGGVKVRFFLYFSSEVFNFLIFMTFDKVTPASVGGYLSALVPSH